jgi:hypothetical protein
MDMAPQAGFEPATLLCGRGLSIPFTWTILDLRVAGEQPFMNQGVAQASATNAYDTNSIARAGGCTPASRTVVLVRPSIGGAPVAPTPDALRPKAVLQPGGERPHLWYGVCPHPVAGRAARTSSRRSVASDRA